MFLKNEKNALNFYLLWTFDLPQTSNGVGQGSPAHSEEEEEISLQVFTVLEIGPPIHTLESWSPSSFQRSADDIGEAKWHVWFIPVVLMKGKFEMFETLRIFKSATVTPLSWDKCRHSAFTLVLH